MNQVQYSVEFVEPGGQLIEPGSEHVTDSQGIDTKVGRMEDGRWLAWVPYYERPGNLHQDTIRAISASKYVATGAVREYYDD